MIPMSTTYHVMFETLGRHDGAFKAPPPECGDLTINGNYERDLQASRKALGSRTKTIRRVHGLSTWTSFLQALV